MGKRNLTILGSTGSVGCSTLEVAKLDPDLNIFALSAYSNIELLVAQCVEHKPQLAVIADQTLYTTTKEALSNAGCETELLAGSESLDVIAAHADVSLVMAAIVGGAGLESSLAAVASGKRLLLANKESLVMSGQLFMDTARDNSAQILPIDSEHNAVFQCLPDEEAVKTTVSKITLTASGGPFLEMPLADFATVTPDQACKHPRWSMGRKISVDSATMMNKGLEVIEASYLFNLAPDKIDVLVHPQSIVHSLVHYIDGSVLAQMANTDMRVPIAYGLAFPARMTSGVADLDLAAITNLNFMPPDMDRFPCLRLGREAVEQGESAPIALNAANEEAVQAFLGNMIPFTQIPLIIEEVLSKTPCESPQSLAIIREVDKQARILAKELILKD